MFELPSDKVSDNIFKNMNTPLHEEHQYLNLIENIIENGFSQNGRNGDTLSIFGHSMRFSLKDNKIPILTTKKTAWRTCLKELLWFINGSTDNKILQQQNVHIWDLNSSPQFLESRNLGYYETGILGPIYGFQWRHFNAQYDFNNGTVLNSNSNSHTNNPGIDQLQQIIDSLKDTKERNSRRLIMTAWNPCQLDQMALPPCHILCQFNVHDGNKLSCALYQRSGDVGLGIPFNIASYSFLTHLLAKHCGLEPYEFVYFLGNCHIYNQHIEAIKEQVVRKPFEFPTLEITCVKNNINDYTFEDFQINNYKSHEAIKMEMIA
jgi:thymidylate synthase